MPSTMTARLNHSSCVGNERVAHKPSDSGHRIHFTGRCCQDALIPEGPLSPQSHSARSSSHEWWFMFCTTLCLVNSPVAFAAITFAAVLNVCFPVSAALLGSLSRHFAPWTLAASLWTHRTARWSWKAVSMKQILPRLWNSLPSKRCIDREVMFSLLHLNIDMNSVYELVRVFEFGVSFGKFNWWNAFERLICNWCCGWWRSCWPH